jgi:WhiB family transcriptional regulator, redox-sensing transcriptional regulator
LANQSPSYEISSAIATDWRQFANCRGTPVDAFFPAHAAGRRASGPDPLTLQAKKLCARCPVRSACLRFALETNQDDGTWGGLDEGERRRYRRQWLTERQRGRVA